MRTIYDLGMGVLILTMAALMFFGVKWQIPQVQDMDELMRYLFGGLCLLYGGFRLYRGIKQKY